MESQPPPTRKRKRPDTEDVIEEKVAELSLEDFPMPPGVNSFGGVEGQNVDLPLDTAAASPSKEDQKAKKRAPVNAEEKLELYKLDLAYFKFLYNGKVVQEHEWSAHMYWCRRKFWQHYYRADPTIEYPEVPASPENQLSSLCSQFANHNPPWWFPGFPNVESHRIKYPRGWKHYKNDIVPPKSSGHEERDAEHARLDIERWTLMSTEQIEGHMQDSENYCTSEREKINAATEVVEEYSEAIESLKRRCVRWQKEVDHQSDLLFRAKSFLRLRHAEELASCDKEPDRKKRRME